MLPFQCADGFNIKVSINVSLSGYSKQYKFYNTSICLV